MTIRRNWDPEPETRKLFDQFQLRLPNFSHKPETQILHIENIYIYTHVTTQL